MGVKVKSPGEIEQMAVAGELVCRILDAVGEQVKPGVSTGDLERRASELLIEVKGARSAFKNYPHPSGGRSFPTVLCTSVNEQVVHGIPSDEVVLREGDILSVDFGLELGGFYGDSARTWAVGSIDGQAKKLLETTNQALQLAIEMCSVGARLNGVGRAVQKLVEGQGFSVVRDFCGHGIGQDLHEEPSIPNYCEGSPRKGMRLRAGVTMALEPMVNEGRWQVELLEDEWTVVTTDRKRSAHFEHTIAVTRGGPRILTQCEDCRVRMLGTVERGSLDGEGRRDNSPG